MPDYTSHAPANLPQMEIALLHQTGPPTNLPQMEITLLHHPC